MASWLGLTDICHALYREKRCIHVQVYELGIFSRCEETSNTAFQMMPSLLSILSKCEETSDTAFQKVMPSLRSHARAHGLKLKVCTQSLRPFGSPWLM